MRQVWACGAVIVGTLWLATRTHAGLLATSGAPGVLGRDISVCFVGNAVTARATFITQIRNYLSEHSAVANIDYNFLGACPAPTLDAAGNQVFTGTMRLVLQGTNVPFTPAGTPTSVPIPGIGCTRSAPAQRDANGMLVLDASGNQIDAGPSFGIFPVDRTPENDTHCQWNMRLGNDGDASGVPWRNHTLHEFGHSLGFAHEFERSDARDFTDEAGCNTSTAATTWINGLPATGSGNTQFTTASYDIASTMNYTMAHCPNYVGNYSQAGLSELERISLHFMYPEDVRVAEYLGTTVVESGKPAQLVGLWEARGASTGTFRMVSSYEWKNLGTVLSTQSVLSIPTASNGPRAIVLTYVDHWGRTYTSSIDVRVLAPSAIRALHAQIPILSHVVLF
jgi:hypothetical protein